MSQVTIGDRSFDIDLIVFDKDGTLIDLNLWGRQLEKWGRLLKDRLALSESAIQSIYEEIGYDLENHGLLPDQPVSVASVEQLMTIAAFLLYRQGVLWTDAERAVQERHFRLRQNLTLQYLSSSAMFPTHCNDCVKTESELGS